MEDETMNESEAVVDESVPRVGSVVRLKSGGELMTVIAADLEGVICAWFGVSESSGMMGFGGGRSLQTRRLPASALVIA